MSITYSQNIRRSASSIGLPCNITYPVPDGAISAGNNDGSDLRHVGDVYRRRFQYTLITINASASFGVELGSSFAFNLNKTISIGLGTELGLQLRNTLNKSLVVGLGTNLDLQVGFTKSMITQVSFGTNLAFQFRSSDIIADTSPSTFCFTTYVTQEVDFAGHITEELDLVGYLKNRC